MALGVITESFKLIAEMAPYLLLGIIVAGAMHVLLPVGFVSDKLGRPGIGSVFKAAALGVPLPLCSCGVVPVAASLKKSGASPGSVVSFLVTTPTSGVDSILATYSLLGLPIAVARVAASFTIGLFAGIATSFAVKPANIPETEKNDDNADDSFSKKTNPVVAASAYAFGELMGGIARPLAIGTLLGGAIAYFLPPGVLEQYIGRGFLSYLVMLAVGIPLYVCASGSIPLAAALLVKGISPGAALIFLIAGPATNAATVTVISGMLGKRALAVYLTFLVLGSLAAGAATDALFALLPSSLLTSGLSSHVHGEGGLSLFEIASGIGLSLLTVYHIIKPIIARLSSSKGGDDMYQLKVPDMTCNHCAGAIKKAVSSIDGVKNVTADPATKAVNIDKEDSVSEETIVDAITQAGFHPEKV